jgi:hypothetical protein
VAGERFLHTAKRAEAPRDSELGVLDLGLQLLGELDDCRQRGVRDLFWVKKGREGRKRRENTHSTIRGPW